jgi:L-amino acid N-acyltransferase YncA
MLYAQTMSHLIVRAAAAADLPAITAIYAHAVLFGTATFEIEPPDEAEMMRRFRELAEGGFPYLVAECGGAVRGYAYAGLYRTRVAYRYTLEDSIYIAPEFHGRGIGRALLDRMLAEATAAGFRQMVAVIGDNAQLASIALHRAAGFRPVGTFEAVGYKFGRWLDTVLMQRALGAGAEAPPQRLAGVNEFNSPPR